LAGESGLWYQQRRHADDQHHAQQKIHNRP
jgi:hypothetical protein